MAKHMWADDIIMRYFYASDINLDKGAGFISKGLSDQASGKCFVCERR